MYHTTVAAHQESAIVCLSLLKELAEKAASFRRIISEALVDASFHGNGQSILDKFFLCDSSLWIGMCCITFTTYLVFQHTYIHFPACY